MRPRLACVSVLVTLLALVAGCTGGTAKKGTDGAPPASQVATADIPGQAAAAEGDLEFIRDLGTSHKGETLYALVVASADTESAATKAALETISQVGDVQSYFVVEPASHIAGLPAGKWHVLEAYRETPTQETIDFMDRGTSAATVYKVTVKCTDPIPVVEDLEADGAP